ncbi:MAG TPA: G5 domain-containing protein [Actinoplanes sp.]|jgi:hypothetical protein
MQPGPKAALIITALLMPCLVGMVAIGAFIATQGSVDAPDRAPAARQLADATATSNPPVATATTATGTTAASTATTVPTTPVATTVVPVVEKRSVVETEKIPYATRRVRDSSLAGGATRVRTKGVAGVKTLTYEVTITNGEETGRKLLSTVVKRPVTKVVAVGTKPKPEKPSRRCDPNYGGCVPIASDVDCAGGSGNGPAYVSGPVEVIGSDIYRLDNDSDGYGCDD